MVAARVETRNFRETKFREISRKLAHFRMIFAFSRKLKNEFSPHRQTTMAGTLENIKSNIIFISSSYSILNVIYQPFSILISFGLTLANETGA
jgi:hypothetical protein